VGRPGLPVSAPYTPASGDGLVYRPSHAGPPAESMGTIQAVAGEANFKPKVLTLLPVPPYAAGSARHFGTSGGDVKKRIWVIVALGIVGPSLAACGGSRSASSGTSTSIATTGPSATSTTLTTTPTTDLPNGVECYRTTGVPNVIGMTVQAAETSLEKSCLYLSISDVVCPSFEAPLGTPGLVAAQSLPAGLTTSSFRVVVLTICTYGNAR
jgi:hypothetical protein